MGGSCLHPKYVPAAPALSPPWHDEPFSPCPLPVFSALVVKMGGMTSDPVGFWEPRSAIIKPHLLDAMTGPDGMRFELAPTMHGALFRVTFPVRHRGSLGQRLNAQLASIPTEI